MIRKIVLIDYDAPEPPSDANTVYIKTGNPVSDFNQSVELRNRAIATAYRMRPDVIEIRVNANAE